MNYETQLRTVFVQTNPIFIFEKECKALQVNRLWRWLWDAVTKNKPNYRLTNYKLFAKQTQFTDPSIPPQFSAMCSPPMKNGVEKKQKTEKNQKKHTLLNTKFEKTNPIKPNFSKKIIF